MRPVGLEEGLEISKHLKLDHIVIVERLSVSGRVKDGWHPSAQRSQTAAQPQAESEVLLENLPLTSAFPDSDAG
jgi:hypothetical protein